MGKNACAYPQSCACTARYPLSCGIYLCCCGTFLRYSPNTMMPVAGIRSVFAKRHDSAVSVLRRHSNRQAGRQTGGRAGGQVARARPKHFVGSKKLHKVNTKLTFRCEKCKISPRRARQTKAEQRRATVPQPEQQHNVLQIKEPGTQIGNLFKFYARQQRNGRRVWSVLEHPLTMKYARQRQKERRVGVGSGCSSAPTATLAASQR